MQTKNTEETNQPTEDVKIVAKAKPKPLKTVSKAKTTVTKPTVEAKPVEQKVAVAKAPVKAKAVAPVKAQAPQAPKVIVPKLPVAEQIWNSIKERELGLFGLAGQTVEKYCQPLNTDPSRCMVKYKVSSVIPALEAAVPEFDFEVMGAYLIISPKK